MCLSVAIFRPDDVLARGTHMGHEWMVIHNTTGYRCGYIKVGKDHPWYGGGDCLDYIDVHGGVTFSEYDKPCDGDGPDDGYWIGFDCAHAGDAPDMTLPNRMNPQDQVMLAQMNRGMGGFVKDQKYVENECRKLCDQAAAMSGETRG